MMFILLSQILVNPSLSVEFDFKSASAFSMRLVAASAMLCQSVLSKIIA